MPCLSGSQRPTFNSVKDDYGSSNNQNKHQNQDYDYYNYNVCEEYIDIREDNVYDTGDV